MTSQVDFVFFLISYKNLFNFYTVRYNVI